MARLLAHLRLLVLLTRRDLTSLSSLGLNNLFFCVPFLAQGSHSPRTAFWTTLPFLLFLVVPLLFSIAADTLTRIPASRAMLLPRTHSQGVFLGLATLALSPAFWLFGTVIAGWAGAAAALLFCALAIVIQGLVLLALQFPTSMRPIRLIPRLPGAFGGLIQIAARQLFSTLDLYAALLIAVAGTLYRFLSPAPQPDAFPILALLVALTLSTYAQSLFGLETPGSLARYRLLPLRGWQILAAKDIAFLAVLALLTLPLHLVGGLTFGLIALAVGHVPSLRKPSRQKPWRFTAGNPAIGLLQIAAGVGIALASVRISPAFLALAAVACAGSLAYANRLWHQRT